MLPGQTDNDQFLGRARYAKGKETLKAIHDATYELIVSEGLVAASQDAIAKKANVSQSAVRHYFPSKEELLLTFFSTGVERLKSILDAKFADKNVGPREKLLDVISTHYDWINAVEDVYYFESASFWGRNPEFRTMRESWYQGITRHYKALVMQIHPGWSRKQCEAVSFQLITLVLGGWITMGNTRAVYRSRSKENLKSMLMSGAEGLIG